MKYRFRATPRFWEKLETLPAKQKDSVYRAWKIFKENPFDPRLRSHKIHGLSSQYGGNLFAGVTLAGSTLYGTTRGGGAYGYGTVFSIPVTGGSPTTLANFTGLSGNGAVADGQLILIGSTLYGTTYGGGPDEDGTVFSVPASGGTITTLASFSGTNGSGVIAGLTPVGNTFYGVTGSGGTFGYGTVFSVPVAGGTITTLESFNDIDGADPTGNLTVIGDTLYGTTSEGGSSGDGTVFSIPVTGGTINTLDNFNGTDGADPNTNLTLVGNMLYGTTSEGGASGDGTVFSVATIPEPSLSSLALLVVPLFSYLRSRKRRTGA